MEQKIKSDTCNHILNMHRARTPAVQILCLCGVGALYKQKYQPKATIKDKVRWQTHSLSTLFEFRITRMPFLSNPHTLRGLLPSTLPRCPLPSASRCYLRACVMCRLHVVPQDWHSKTRRLLELPLSCKAMRQPTSMLRIAWSSRLMLSRMAMPV